MSDQLPLYIFIGGVMLLVGAVGVSNVWESWRDGTFLSDTKDLLADVPKTVGTIVGVIAGAALIIIHLSYIPQSLLWVDFIGAILFVIGYSIYTYRKKPADRLTK